MMLAVICICMQSTDFGNLRALWYLPLAWIFCAFGQGHGKPFI